MSGNRTPEWEEVRGNYAESVIETRTTTHDEAEAEFDRFIDKVRAESVRETARYIERITPKGLVNRAAALADMNVAADRLERGVHVNGMRRHTPG